MACVSDSLHGLLCIRNSALSPKSDYRHLRVGGECMQSQREGGDSLRDELGLNNEDHTPFRIVDFKSWLQQYPKIDSDVLALYFTLHREMACFVGLFGKKSAK